MTDPRFPAPPRLTPRQWLAFGLGIGALVTLILVFRGPQGSGGGLFRAPEEPVLISTGTINAGDVLGVVLVQSGVRDPYLIPVQKAFSKLYSLNRIQPGHAYEVVTSTDGIFRRFTYWTGPVRSFLVTRSSAGVFNAEEHVEQTVWVEKRVAGVVTESMYRDLLKAGHSETFVANLVGDFADNIFGWQIDFFTEQRPGERFLAILEQEHLPGSDTPLKGGGQRILAASYTGSATRNKENVAIRFQPEGGKADYYDADGKAVRRAFLRAPFTHGAFRVSSRYNRNRFHPILRVYRPHHGTDYAAASGTPVAAVGKGAVVRAGWYKGYGNCVDIRHNGTYTSRYGHLSSIAKNVRVGTSVSQGQFIGRVGSTGLSTGPHLHFEMLVNGSQRDFLRMSFPAGEALAQSQMPAFQAVRSEMLNRLSVAAGTETLAAAPRTVEIN